MFIAIKNIKERPPARIAKVRSPIVYHNSDGSAIVFYMQPQIFFSAVVFLYAEKADKHGLSLHTANQSAMQRRLVFYPFCPGQGAKPGEAAELPADERAKGRDLPRAFQGFDKNLPKKRRKKYAFSRYF